MANRLAAALSPYLLQHASNPVDWWEWSPEAFAEAKQRDLPILLSVGYAACHWCHVMAHESFEDPTVAAAINAGCVAVKVDREERPDVDAAYMAATTAMTGAGGWPMTVFLTPDLLPFFAGTYFAKPALLQLLARVQQLWQERREDVVAQSRSIAEQLNSLTQTPPAHEVDDDVLAAAVVGLAGSFDPANAGFGGAPKFPPSMVLEFLLRHHNRVGDPGASEMAARTLTAMARGGIYDQLAGGFARYSVDAGWVVPHFEKMLYDNALLLGAYLSWYRSTGNELARRVAAETADFLVHDLGTPAGAFASALDADTDGVEGLTYVWSPADLRHALGPQDAQHAAEVFVVTDAGTFEHGRSTLQLPADPVDDQWWQRVRATLLAARGRRPQPARDDKVVTSWNGLAISALVGAAQTLDRPDLLLAASRCAQFLLDCHVVEGRLRRTSRDGSVGSAPGVAADYGNLTAGLLAVHQADMDPGWLNAAGRLLDTALDHFSSSAGGFHDSADDAEQLYLRPDSVTDNAEPSGPAALAGALVTYGALTGSARHLEAGSAAVAAAGDIARRQPRFAGWTLAVAEALAAGPLQVAVVGSDNAAARMAAVARASRSPGLVVAVGTPDAPGIPLLAGRPLVDGHSAAYVCRGFVCDTPITDAESLRRKLLA